MSSPYGPSGGNDPQQPWGQPGSAYPGTPQPDNPHQHYASQHFPGRHPNQGPPYGQPRYVAPPKPGIVPLRPLMFGEIMDGSFQVIRRCLRRNHPMTRAQV